MSTAAPASLTARAAGRLRGWLSVRHSLRSEVLVVLALYGLYELARGLVVGDASLTLHFAVTAGVLLWLHQRRPAAFPLVRTTLLLASGLALVGFLLYPTAPPRLADIGVADTVSKGHVDLNHGLVSSLYNPYAAVPSMHIGYALIVATSLLRHGTTSWQRSDDRKTFCERWIPAV